MNRIQSDGMNNDVSIESLGISHHYHTNAVHVATGALGRSLNGSRVCSETSEEKKAVIRRHISIVQAENALQRLFSASQGGEGKPSLRNVLQMDPIMLSMMTAQLMLSVSASNAQALCQQIERATETQNVLRDRKVKEYQEQIQHAVEQADKARKSGLVNVAFDWIIGVAELGIGALKIYEGLLTGNLLDVVDGAAYFAAGVSGMVKAGAETALACGADKDSCQSIIDTAGTVQHSCEGVAMALDIIQAGRAICTSRAVISVTEKVLDSGLGEKILDGIVEGAEEGIEVLAEEVGEAVGEKLVQDFGKEVEREMVEVGDMASEAAARSVEAEAGKVGSKALLEEGVELTEETLSDTITSELRDERVGTVVDSINNVNEILQPVVSIVGVLNEAVNGVIELDAAETRKRIEQLIVQQSFIDFMEDWTENQKETQKKRLQEAYQQSSEAIKSTLQIIDSYGSVLAGIAYGRA